MTFLDAGCLSYLAVRQERRPVAVKMLVDDVLAPSGKVRRILASSIVELKSYKIRISTSENCGKKDNSSK